MYFSIAGPPEVNIIEMGSSFPGEQYYLVCDVKVEAGSLTVFWQHNGEKLADGVVPSGLGTTAVTLMLAFDPLTYQDAGEYICVGISNVLYPNTTSLSFPVQVQGKKYFCSFLQINFVTCRLLME